MFEDLKASITLIMQEIAARPEDRHILQEALREKISELRTMGLPVPQDILKLEEALEDPENDDLWNDLPV
jgi:hypothetical protein